MKILILFLLTFSPFAFGKSDFTFYDFEGLSFEQKVQVMDAYKDFLKTYAQKTELSALTSVRFSFFAEAWASGNFDCFYAGWPSRSSTRSGGRKVCSSPMTGNPDYRRLASSCGSSSLLCQPAIFGSGLCVSVATPALRNSAFNQCERKFSDAGRTSADVVREMDSPQERADFQELMGISESVCRDGFQPGICNRLNERISQIREAGGATLLSATTTAVAVTTTGVSPGPVDCDPNTPGIQTVPPQRPTSLTLSSTIIRRGCGRPAISGAAPAESDILPQLAANNISIVAGSISDTRILARFLEEFNRFPAPLREEMKRNGSRVNLIFGQGVSEDPSWAQEAARSANPNEWQTTHDGRPWSQVPGAGGSLGAAPTPTRIVVNRMYEGHGSQSLFLHEYAHTFDSMYGEHAITHSQTWQQALARDTRSHEFVQAICGNYCNDAQHSEEAFAELFAYYFACPESQNHMRQFLPTISRLFDRMTSGREVLDGRVNLDEPAPVIATTPTPQTQSGLIVTTADGVPLGNPQRAITAGSAFTNPTPQGVVASRVTTDRTQSQLQAPSVSRSPQSTSGVVTPAAALQLISTGQLRYLGRGLLPGSDTVGSCVFFDGTNYVIVHACRRDGREAPATNIEIITPQGQKISYYIENSEATDRNVGMPSQVRRENYDRSFRISYQKMDPPPTPYSLESMRAYLQRGQSDYSNVCYTGGMTLNQRDSLSVCNRGVVSEFNSWQPAADAFYNEPGDAWYSFLRTMRQKVQATAGR